MASMTSLGEALPSQPSEVASSAATDASPAGAVLCAAGCGKVATMACPTCKKLNVKPLPQFCAQSCFESFWPTHKTSHKAAKAKAAEAASLVAATAQPPEWAKQYQFTGTLRPYAYAPRRFVPPSVPWPDYAQGSVPHSERADKASNSAIKVYSPAEIVNIREACRIGRLALDAVGAAIKVGVTTAELDGICHQVHLDNKAYPSPLNYYKFPNSVCTSVNEVICHGIPDTRPLEDGDIVNIDVSTYIGGCHGDLNETFLVGNVDAAGRKVVKTAFECLSAALNEVRAGTMYRDLGKAISKTADRQQCSVVRTYCGHGIGKLFHTAPNVPHYAKNKAKGVMAVGHIFTVEPMINEGRWQDETWPDNWTAVTIDGGRSAQFEHTVLITERTEENPKGYEILTMRAGEPTMVWSDEKFQR